MLRRDEGITFSFQAGDLKHQAYQYHNEFGRLVNIPLK